jgi:hypothetical protein
MVTKSELLAKVRKAGVRVSDRQLTTLITEGLVPKSARIGSRSGAFPAIVVDLVVFIARAREIGLEHKAIRELTPIWRFLIEAVAHRNIDLIEFERIARREATSSEAAFAIPWLLQVVLGRCPRCGSGMCEEPIKITYRNGSTEILRAGEKPPIISFLMAEPGDDDEPARVVSSMRIVLPVPIELEDHTRVLLGVPNGVEVVTSWGKPNAGEESDN